METLRSSETSVNFYRTTQGYILEDIALHNHYYDVHKRKLLFPRIF
jgi:hypothetical protein